MTPTLISNDLIMIRAVTINIKGINSDLSITLKG